MVTVSIKWFMSACELHKFVSFLHLADKERAREGIYLRRLETVFS